MMLSIDGKKIADLLPKDTDWKKAFTTQFVKDLKITAQ